MTYHTIHRRKGKDTIWTWCGLKAVWQPNSGWTHRAVMDASYNCLVCRKAIDKAGYGFARKDKV